MVLMVASFLSPSLATAAEPVLPTGSAIDMASFGSMMLKLALVLALIVAGGWIVRRLQHVQRGTSKTLEVLDVLPVGPKERILLVRAGETQLLVGQTPGRLNTLQRLDRPVAFADQVARELTEHAA